MTLLHLFHAVAVGGLLCGAAALAEAGLRGSGRPARAVWLVALVMTALAPVWGPWVSGPTLETLALDGATAVAATVGTAPNGAPTPGLFDTARKALLAPHPALTWLWVLVGVIATTAVAMGLVRLERRAARWPQALLDGETVAVSPDFGPAVVGLRQPRTVLPRWVMTLAGREIALILDHERAHRSARDGVVLALGLLVAAACAWNPLVWLQFKRLRDAVEMDCDRRLLRSGTPVPAYARVLVLVRLRAAAVGGATAALVEPSSSLERRLKMMRAFPWTRRRVALTGAAALGLMVVACEAPAPTATGVDTSQAEQVTAQYDEVPVDTLLGATLRLRTPDSGPGPLTVVDGIIVDGARLSDLAAMDIESVEVFKGGAALERFGERGRDGVIIVTTKGGEERDEVIHITTRGGEEHELMPLLRLEAPPAVGTPQETSAVRRRVPFGGGR